MYILALQNINEPSTIRISILIPKLRKPLLYGLKAM